MRKRTREILALVLLALLGTGAACAMGWYILVGHGWNVTASNIDDSIGQMDGYTVFLVDGTRNPEAIQAKDEIRSEAGDGSGEEGARRSVEADEAAQGPGTDTATGEPPAATEDGVANEVLTPEVEGEGFSLEALARSYEEKGAEVYRLASLAGSLYDEPIVVSRGSHRVGVFSLRTPARPAAARMAAKGLAHRDADLIVALTDDASLVSAPLRGVDIIVRDIADEEPQRGFYSQGAFCVDTPLIGEVEAVIVSPSGVVSSKTLADPAASSEEQASS